MMLRLLDWLKKHLVEPKVVIFLALGVVYFLMLKVIPTFADVFASFGHKLPSSTLFVIKNSWIIFLVMFLYLTLLYLKQKEVLKLDWLKEWMLISFLGITLAFIVYAMFEPMFELGDLTN